MGFSVIVFTTDFTILRDSKICRERVSAKEGKFGVLSMVIDDSKHNLEY